MEDSEGDRQIRRGLEGYLSTQLERTVAITDLSRPTATGFSAETMLIEAGSPDRDRPPTRLVVQAAPVGPALFDDYDLARTFRVQRELRNHDVPVAAMRWLCEDPKWIGTPFYVMDFVPGRVPPDRPPYHDRGWLFEADLAERREIWMAGVEAIAALHRVPVDGFSFLASADGDTAARRIAHWREFGHQLGLDGEPILLEAIEALDRNRPEAGAPAVHWGDAKLGNMIFDDDGVAAILDWELCGLSVGEEDLAHWMAVDWFLSTGLGVERLAGLPGPRSTIARYEAAVGASTTGVEWWFIFALVRMGLIFQRAAVQSRRRKGGDGPLRPNVIAAQLGRLMDGSAWTDYEDRNSEN